MANWQRKLNLVPEWNQANEEEITVQELSKFVAVRLKALKPFTNVPDADSINEQRDDLVDGFESLAKDPGADFKDFNYVMSDLYDWADTSLDSEWNGKKVCWINKF